MNRRSFLQLLSTGALGAVIAPELDLERLLWVPGQKTIFLPSATLGTFDPIFYTNEALRILANSLGMCRFFAQHYDGTFPRGDTTAIKIPQRFTWNPAWPRL